MVSKMYSVIFDVYLDKIILAFWGSLPRQCKLRAMKNRRMTLRSMAKYSADYGLVSVLSFPPFFVLFFIIILILEKNLPEYLIVGCWGVAIVCFVSGTFFIDKLYVSLNDSFFEECSIKDTKWHIKWGCITFLYTISFTLFILKLGVIVAFLKSLLHG